MSSYVCRYGIFIEDDGEDLIAIAAEAEEKCQDPENKIWQVCDLDTGKCVVVDLTSKEIIEAKVVQL